MIVDLDVGVLDGLVQSRRSIRAFRPESVPRDEVAELLRLAMWAPSPHNAQPWRFTVLFLQEDRTRLAEVMANRLASELRENRVDAEAIERQTSRSRWRITNAPVVLVCSLVGDGLVTYPDQRRARLEWQMAVQSLGAVLQTLFLLAAARGIGTCWMAAPMYCVNEVRQMLDLPDDHDPQALVLMGYPAKEGKVRDRRPLQEVVDLR
ncbi:MAG TPA: nitroreductase family protein [Chloroflexota bacterium]